MSGKKEATILPLTLEIKVTPILPTSFVDYTEINVSYNPREILIAMGVPEEEIAGFYLPTIVNRVLRVPKIKKE